MISRLRLYLTIRCMYAAMHLAPEGMVRASLCVAILGWLNEVELIKKMAVIQLVEGPKEGERLH